MTRHQYAARAGPDLHLLALPAAPAALTAVRQTLTDWATTTSLRPDQVSALCLASYEALANAVQHAYPDGHPGVLDLHANNSPTQVSVTIADHGRWLPTAIDPDAPGGYGLPLIHGLAEAVTITPSPHGTTVRLTWNLPAPAE